VASAASSSQAQKSSSAVALLDVAPADDKSLGVNVTRVMTDNGYCHEAFRVS